MECVTISVGRPGLIFPAQNRVRMPFSLPRPVSAVYPLLQSFRYSHTDDDRELLKLAVRLVPFFNAGVSQTDGEVEIETAFVDGGGLIAAAAAVELQIRVLVVGV